MTATESNITPLQTCCTWMGKRLWQRWKKLLTGMPILWSGFASLGYDAPGYGYGDKTEDGTPLIQVGLARLAEKYDVPYIIDNAFAAPIVGADVRKLGADVVTYSMDKVTGAPTCGLMMAKKSPWFKSAGQWESMVLVMAHYLLMARPCFQPLIPQGSAGRRPGCPANFA